MLVAKQQGTDIIALPSNSAGRVVTAWISGPLPVWSAGTYRWLPWVAVCPSHPVVAQGARFMRIALPAVEGRALVHTRRFLVFPLEVTVPSGDRRPTANPEEEAGSLHTTRVHIIENS